MSEEPAELGADGVRELLDALAVLTDHYPHERLLPRHAYVAEEVANRANLRHAAEPGPTGARPDEP